MTQILFEYGIKVPEMTALKYPATSPSNLKKEVEDVGDENELQRIVEEHLKAKGCEVNAGVPFIGPVKAESVEFLKWKVGGFDADKLPDGANNTARISAKTDSTHPKYFIGIEYKVCHWGKMVGFRGGYYNGGATVMCHSVDVLSSLSSSGCVILRLLPSVPNSRYRTLFLIRDVVFFPAETASCILNGAIFG